MKQQALALKYRPIDFDELVGQEAVSRTLSLALDSKRLSHAYLFSGLRGSGKTSSARIFARALECDKGPCSKPCGECPNCIAANPHKMHHIDIIELDGASNRGIEEIRGLIEQTKYHPNMGRFKIFIIDEVHMLTREAHNALLKTLEEPPEYVKFILATTDPLKLPATILSRTQHFRFKQISNKSIFEHLKKILRLENISYQDDALQLIVRSGAGSLRDTLTLLDQAIIYSNCNLTREVCTNMLGLINTHSFEILFESIFKQDREEIFRILEGFFEYEAGMLFDEMGIFLKNKLFSRDDSRYNPLIVERFFRIIAQAKELLFLGTENEFTLTLSVFKMLESLKIETIDQAIKRLEEGFFENIQSVKNPENTSKNNTQESTSKEPTKSVPKDNYEEYFALLQQKIYDLDYDLGEIFAHNVKFISYEEPFLTWETSANGAERERLIESYAQIKNCVFEIFGFQTEIKTISKPKTQESQPESPKEPTKSQAQVESQESKESPNPIQSSAESQLQEPTLPPMNPQNSPEQSPQNTVEEEVIRALETPFLKDLQESLEIKKINVRPLQTKMMDS